MIKTHKLCITGYDWDGAIGAIRDSYGKPLYNIDVDNLTSKEHVMRNQILAIDNIELLPKKHKLEPVSVRSRGADVYQFDLEFSVNTKSGPESVARIRLSDKQARELYDLLYARYSTIE
ncbi:MAG: hypothetical protein WAQ25_02845 [Candidatus Saccharimonas sp.]